MHHTIHTIIYINLADILVRSKLHHFYPGWLVYQVSLAHGRLMTPSRSEMLTPAVVT